MCPKKFPFGRQGDITKTLPLEQLGKHDLQIVVVVLPPQTVLLRVCIVGHAGHLGLAGHRVHHRLGFGLRRRQRWGRQGLRWRLLHQQLRLCLVVPLNADLTALQAREQRSARLPAYGHLSYLPRRRLRRRSRTTQFHPLPRSVLPPRLGSLADCTRPRAAQSPATRIGKLRILAFAEVGLCTRRMFVGGGCWDSDKFNHLSEYAHFHPPLEDTKISPTFKEMPRLWLWLLIIITPNFSLISNAVKYMGIASQIKCKFGHAHQVIIKKSNYFNYQGFN